MFRSAMKTVLQVLVITLLGNACGAPPDPGPAISDLGATDVNTRLVAARSLGEIGGENAIRALTAALRDGDPRVQRAAVLALAKIGAPAVLHLAADAGVGENRPAILEYDPERSAMIEPGADRQLPRLAGDAAVLCFFPEVIAALAKDGTLRPLADLGGESGIRTVYQMDVAGSPVAVLHPGVGAPMAAASLETLIAMGARRIIVIGGAGALVPELALGDLVLVSEAVRGEGTSYAYLPAGEQARSGEKLRDLLHRHLEKRTQPFHTGMAWTTDAIYRETRSLVEQRRRQGCLVVEMEAAALFAVGAFRGVQVAALVYAADTLAGESWDHRDWRNLPELRRKMLTLAAEALVFAGESARP